MQRLNDFHGDRTCSTCFKPITDADWESMELVGYQVIPPWKDDPGEVLEMRNHVCGSTLTIQLPQTALEFEAEVEREQKRSGQSLKQARAVVAHQLKKLR